jgi:hypothetical protein
LVFPFETERDEIKAKAFVLDENICGIGSLLSDNLFLISTKKDTFKKFRLDKKDILRYYEFNQNEHIKNKKGNHYEKITETSDLQYALPIGHDLYLLCIFSLSSHPQQ